jgi:hypothetical protein
VKYTRITAGYTWTDYRTNADIAKELNINSILDKIQEYRRNWLQYINRMSRDRVLSIIKNYRSKDRRSQGRTLKRLLGEGDRNRSTSGPSPC